MPCYKSPIFAIAINILYSCPFMAKTGLNDFKFSDPGLEVTPGPKVHSFIIRRILMWMQRAIWVTKVNYRRSKTREEGDRVVALEDTDLDGFADKSTVFVQDPYLVAPMGIGVIDNVIYVSQTPDIIKYTDVNRNLVFDEGDKREIFLTGFIGSNHDHSTHSVIGGPDGKLYFNQGNCGAKITDRSNRTFYVGSFYYNKGGRKSDGILIPPLLPERRVMMAMFGFPDLPDESTWTERAWRL